MRTTLRRRTAGTLVCLLLGALATTGCDQLPAPSLPDAPIVGADDVPEGGLIWSDEFNGAKGDGADLRYWRHDLGGGGWGNGELQCYTDDRANSQLDGNGNMVITAIPRSGYGCSKGTTNDWTSAKLITAGKVSQRYGLIEMRARLPSGVGTWPAFWMLGTNRAQVGWPACGEIDILEAIGRDPRKVMGTLHGPPDGRPDTPLPNAENGNPKQQYHLGSAVFADQNLSEAFHTYSVNWSPERISFLFDGVEYFTATPDMATSRGGEWVFDQPFYVILNLAVGGKFGGTPSAEMRERNQRYLIDYVRIYK